MLYKLQYDQVYKFWGNFLLIGMLFWFFREISRDLCQDSILLAYLWLSLLISSLTYD